MVGMEGARRGREVLQEGDDLFQGVRDWGDAGAGVKLQRVKGRDAGFVVGAESVESTMQVSVTGLLKNGGRD